MGLLNAQFGNAAKGGSGDFAEIRQAICQSKQSAQFENRSIYRNARFFRR